MKVDSLDELRSAFADWRKNKKYRQEAIPEGLLARAQRCTSKHGVREVARAAGVDRCRLLQEQVAGEMAPAVPAQKAGVVTGSTPGYSRLDLAMPSVARSPIAEIETDTGIKLRLFEQTPEVLGLLGALCGVGGMK